MQKSGFAFASALPPRKINRCHTKRTDGLIATNDITQKSEPWDRAGLYLNSTQNACLVIFCARYQKVRFLTPFFDGARPTTTTCRNCNYPIRTHYVSCDHPSIMQAKI